MISSILVKAYSGYINMSKALLCISQLASLDIRKAPKFFNKGFSNSRNLAKIPLSYSMSFLYEFRYV